MSSVILAAGISFGIQLFSLPSFAEEHAAPFSGLERVIELVQAGKIKEARQVNAGYAKQWRGTEHAHWATYGTAVILQHEGEPRKAFRILQNVADLAPALREMANDRQLDICISSMSKESPDGWHPGKPSPKWVKRMLEEVHLNDPTAGRAPKLYYYLGLFYEQAGNVRVADAYYAMSADRRQDGEWYDRSFFAVSRMLYRESRAMPRDMDVALKARTMLERYAAYDSGIYQAAAGPMLDETTRLIHKMAFEQARFYDKTMYPALTKLTAYRNFLDDHPGAEQAKMAQHRIEQIENEHPQERSVMPVQFAQRTN